jgi:FemAB-related protein (PEP-CTERM system-associated)
MLPATLATPDPAPTICSVTDTTAAWRRTVERLPQATLAHAAEWFGIIARSYGHDPLYLMAGDMNGGRSVLPAFVVRRPMFGTVVTSMPFLDGGGPCGSSPALTNLLVGRLIADARARGARLVELRCKSRLAIDAPPMANKVNMSLELPPDPDWLWRRLDKSVRNQVRRAERSGLSIEVDAGRNLPQFYETFVSRMRDLGSPVHAQEFLAATLESFGRRARLVLVRKGDSTVGGLIALEFKDRLVVPWATCLKEYFPLCPNMLLYWQTIRAACTEGFSRFDFGRSTRQSGTYHFKRQWGAQEEPLFWYRIPLAPGKAATSADDGHGTGAGVLAKMWQRLPLPVTRQLGPRIRKYLTQ